MEKTKIDLLIKNGSILTMNKDSEASKNVWRETKVGCAFAREQGWAFLKNYLGHKKNEQDGFHNYKEKAIFQ